MVSFHQSNINVTGVKGGCCWPFIYLFIYFTEPFWLE